MSIRRVFVVVTLALLTLAGLAGPAWAGGRPEPPPDYGPASIAVGVVAAGIAIVGLSIATRRMRR